MRSLVVAVAPVAVALVAGPLSLVGCATRVVVQDSPEPELAPPPHSVRGAALSLGVPRGHYPPPGRCRLWLRGRPPGHQPRPCRCEDLGEVPPGAMVLHRPADDERLLQVTTYDPERPRVIMAIDWYDARSGERYVP